MKQTQSLAGYIRQHLAELESRLEVGVRQEAIVKELQAAGYETTLKGFRNFLYRARIWAQEKESFKTEKPKEHAHVKSKPTQTQEKDEGTNSIETHRPTDLDAIHNQEVDLRSLAKFAKRKKQ